MPNHCENDLYISGPSEEVERLLTHIQTDETIIDFNKIIAYPEDLDFNGGGYEWCIQNWGTKWNAYAAVRRDYGPYCITFQTAWGPPAPVIVALHKMFPKLTLSLEFFECGMAFCGGFTCESEDDFYEDDRKWEPGFKAREWKGEYRGTRGG